MTILAQDQHSVFSARLWIVVVTGIGKTLQCHSERDLNLCIPSVSLYRSVWNLLGTARVPSQAGVVAQGRASWLPWPRDSALPRRQVISLIA